MYNYIMEKLELNLTANELNELKKIHKVNPDKKVCDRIKSILLYHRGYSYTEIGDILLVDDDTAKRYIVKYIEDQSLSPNHKGKPSQLNELQTNELIAHLKENIYLSSLPIIRYVKQKYNITYSISGMTAWLKANNFSYKKPKLLPKHVDTKVQEAFIEHMTTLKNSGELLFYADSVHPTHQTKPAYGWVSNDINVGLKSIPSQKRMNISGIIEIESKSMVYEEESESVHSQTITKLFDQLLSKYGSDKKLNIILDNAKYHKSSYIKAYIKNNHNIVLHFLPAYSPNLNLIERVWRFMNKKIKDNQYYDNFNDLKTATRSFLDNINQYKSDLDKLLSFSFETINFNHFKIIKS
jgi:transposase